MWDTTPRHIAFRAHGRQVVTSLQFDTDKIITGDDKGKITVHDTKTGALRSTLEGHTGGVWGLEYHENILVSGSTDRSIRIWDIEKAECTHVFHGHTSTVRTIQLLLPVQVGLEDGTPVMRPESPLVISGSRDATLRVWKLPQPGDSGYLPSGDAAGDEDCPFLIRVLKGHTHSVRAMAAHRDTLVSGSYDQTVVVWQVSTGEILHQLRGHESKVYSVALDHKRNRCMSGSMDCTVKIWCLDTGAMLFNLQGHTSLVGIIGLEADLLVSAAADSTIRIWDPENGECKNTLSGHSNAITAFQHDSEKLISGSDTELKLWNVRTGVCEKDLLTDLNGVWQVRFGARQCVAAVQRGGLTFIEILDFGASEPRPLDQSGERIVVDELGVEVESH